MENGWACFMQITAHFKYSKFVNYMNYEIHELDNFFMRSSPVHIDMNNPHNYS